MSAVKENALPVGQGVKTKSARSACLRESIGKRLRGNPATQFEMRTGRVREQLGDDRRGDSQIR